ncbi:MAG: C39 family peptidase [Akkermansiaceae bacterium]|nr:C39 family peptidase [Akkermansiaceae bacterium]MDP4646527.1 C39 family peptidase [Akkermansiaceae bacterium]MDP4720476.1 C39 family peptidase [Akkermansiaceae bacterium]MDP4779312.1 C39 family peptidase [Akkermansiaceae bacterium]MDP4846476.1 C39 family peptidase [Akkermansiaceae bacterium]
MTQKNLTGAIIACLCGISQAAELRNFRNASNDLEIKASFEGLKGEIVTLRGVDGDVFDTPLDFLSKEDQDFIRNTASGTYDDAAKINKAVGLAFANGNAFSRLDAETVAKSLKLKPESTSKHGKSWRLYSSFVQGYTLFGAMPYSVALYSDDDGKVENISVVYANKGDYGSTAGFAQDHFKNSGAPEPGSLEEAMNLDEKTVSSAITSVLGESTEQRYGESGTRRTIKRWDWNDHSFLLSNEEGEYVSLSIVSTEMADNDGKSERMSDAELKKRLIDNIVHEENGDVYISEIPMVDQGPKGYCVPATFERAMRTMGIDADMYLLAMVGQSQAGGGTVVELLLENVKSAVYRKGRRTKEDEIKNLKIRDIKRYIDEGSPVMWSMCSMDDYNEIADENTAGRAAGKADFREKMDTKAAKLAASEKPEDNRHICMIIGYNETTNEIAVSDSWGKRFEKRWVPLPAADWASAGKLFMILP